MKTQEDANARSCVMKTKEDDNARQRQDIARPGLSGVKVRDIALKGGPGLIIGRRGRRKEKEEEQQLFLPLMPLSRQNRCHVTLA